MTEPRKRRLVQKLAEVIYLVNRLPKYPDAMAPFKAAISEPGALIVFPFGAETRSERVAAATAHRRGWDSRAIEEVRVLDERRGRNRK